MQHFLQKKIKLTLISILLKKFKNLNSNLFILKKIKYRIWVLEDRSLTWDGKKNYKS